MTKTLSTFTFGDIVNAHLGKLIAFTPVVCEHGIALGIATANEPGYHPVSPTHYCVPDWDVASTEAERLNILYGHTVEAAERIVASSMAASNRRKSEAAVGGKEVVQDGI
ncbi:hypothetical protein [Phaeobacter piscinae]|uniref:hypothetical protein n=1 Tax=Phaeobacter piscinae TaxID=1580596 RepID=UPI00058EFB8E|nr:hypothetical protein [Phaeobacter piscinae]UTS82727.1 hypothetical protein OL67_003837 [Phaeobacter piscinae]